jgi:hypothetical protein
MTITQATRLMGDACAVVAGDLPAGASAPRSLEHLIDEVLEDTFMPFRVQMKVQDRVIRYKRGYFSPVDARGWLQMGKYNGSEVFIAYDPRDLGSILALDAQGNYLAWLVYHPWPRSAQSWLTRLRVYLDNWQPTQRMTNICDFWMKIFLSGVVCYFAIEILWPFFRYVTGGR